MRARAAVAAAALALMACSQSSRHSDNLDAEDQKKEWKELPVKYPARPRSNTLVRFDVGDGSPHRFYIDPPSLSVGADGVVRYTLVTRTAGGATNVTYEGIRCEGRRHKLYAVGHDDGTWRAARDPQWRRIEMQDLDRHNRALVDNYLCVAGSPRGSPQAILGRLKGSLVEYPFQSSPPPPGSPR